MSQGTSNTKETILHILGQGGEYTRPTLAALCTPSDASRKEIDAACRLIVEMDLAGEVSVRIAGGEAYYSKLKTKGRAATPGISAGTGPDIHQKNRRVKPVVVESVAYGEGVQR